ncbi:hypothetical protein [Stenotrophomonas acidaminiphila]|uniref:hypothetical protein n=1 Tax=Stenotrophomonas acidaminiphila TaxID=128780 RepID=UPI0039BD5C3D
MENTAAHIILANLRERIEIDSDGKYRLSGVITQKELDALEHFITGQASPPSEGAVVKAPPVAPVPAPTVKATVIPEPEPEVTLNLSTLELADSDISYRVCLDFGTAMSKATFVHDDDELEDIQVLQLGVPGDQENIDMHMLVSSVFIDTDGLLWFGQKAVEHSLAAIEGDHARMDNIKRALSEGNLAEPVDSRFNPTTYQLTYEDIVLAYLAFFTWTINYALSHDVDSVEIAPNFRRRFAMPCFPRANARMVEAKLKSLLGEAQVLADTFGEDIHQGLPLSHFLLALKQLRQVRSAYSFIDGSVTEPLGVAGSLLSWRTEEDSLALVVDIGAGTSDFSLYRLKLSIDDDGNIKSAAGEVDGTARGITEAGNHLDKILMAFILSKAGVDASHPKRVNITHDLDREIRNHKESLFNTGSVLVTLYTGEEVDVSLDEFMALDAIKAFEDVLRSTLVAILQDADSEWVNWVRYDPRHRLTIALTGGGANLPMARKLAESTVTAHGVTIPVAAAKSFPEWLRKDYPELEEPYPRIAVSLGGARQNTFRSMGVLKTTGLGTGHTLERFPTQGN